MRPDFLRRIVSRVAIVLWTIVWFGLPQAAEPAAAGVTGIRGQVLLGPVRPGPSIMGQPDEAPFRATFHVVGADGKAAASFQSDENGRFQALVPAGEYTIVPDRSAPIRVPGKQKKKVTVPPDGFADVTLRFDTGMR
jgi:hypothetical protein